MTLDETRLERLTFTDKMGDLSNKTFKQVYETNEDFVEFSKVSMSKGTGIFKYWLKYIGLKQKADDKVSN
jgi:hypothetical protein